MKRNFTRVSVKLSAFLLVIYIVAVVARPSHEEYSEEEDDDDDDEDDVDDDDEDGYKLPSPSVIITDGIDGTHVQSLQVISGFLKPAQSALPLLQTQYPELSLTKLTEDTIYIFPFFFFRRLLDIYNNLSDDS